MPGKTNNFTILSKAYRLSSLCNLLNLSSSTDLVNGGVSSANVTRGLLLGGKSCETRLCSDFDALREVELGSITKVCCTILKHE